MLNKNNERELCYVVSIDNILPIEDADRVEIAVVGGWRVMVRKNQFKPGDLAVYFEIDSKVPAREPFMFLESKGFKIKTQKYFKGTVLSQGLLMSFEDFGWEPDFHKRGDFLTKELGVIYSVEEDNKRKANSVNKYEDMARRHKRLFSKPPFKTIMKYPIGRDFLFIFFGNKKQKKDWPAWVSKTDEERIQCMPWILENKEPWVASEKVDGTSTTFTMKRGKKFLWFAPKYEFYVCSRNVVFSETKKECYYPTNVYFEMAEKYHVQAVLEKLLKENPSWDWVTLQGETYGEGIQKRDYTLKGRNFAGFNFITSADGRWDSMRAKSVMEPNGIPWVPIVDDNYVLPDTIEELLAFATGDSLIDGKMREGLVFRSKDGTKSFKAVSNEFLMKYHR